MGAQTFLRHQYYCALYSWTRDIFHYCCVVWIKRQIQKSYLVWLKQNNWTQRKYTSNFVSRRSVLWNVFGIFGCWWVIRHRTIFAWVDSDFYMMSYSPKCECLLIYRSRIYGFSRTDTQYINICFELFKCGTRWASGLGPHFGVWFMWTAAKTSCHCDLKCQSYVCVLRKALNWSANIGLGGYICWS